MGAGCRRHADLHFYQAQMSTQPLSSAVTAAARIIVPAASAGGLAVAFRSRQPTTLHPAHNPAPHPPPTPTPNLYHAEGRAEPAGEEPLTRRQLLQRRLARTEQLAGLYHSEMWALLEELRLRHKQFAAQQGCSVWKEAGAGQGPAAVPRASPQAGEEGEEEEAAGQHARKRQKDGQGPQAAAKAAAALNSGGGDEGQQQQQHTPSSGSSAGTGEGKGPGSPGEPGCALRALWERRQRGEQPPAEGGQQAEGEDKQQVQPTRRGRQGKAAARKEPAEKKRTRRQEQQEAAQTAAGKAGGDRAVGAPPSSRQEAEQPAETQGAQQAPQAQLPPPPPLLPRFEEVEELLLNGAAAGLPPPDEAALLAARSRFVRRLSLLGRLEQSSLAGACRELDSVGGLALLCGRRRRFVLRRGAVTLGRSTESVGKVRRARGHVRDCPGCCCAAQPSPPAAASRLPVRFLLPVHVVLRGARLLSSQQPLPLACPAA